MTPLVSIVITTKNEEKHIQDCLKSIKNQSYIHIEIIVVDNNSSDKTKEIALRFTKQVFNKGPERSAQRNFGVNKAKGKYILYLDADMTLSQNLVNTCVRFIEEKKCSALHISEIITGSGYWNKVRRFERSFYDGTVVDGARFFTKDILIKVQGFDESLTGPEDWDLDKKIKKMGTICLLPKQGEDAVIFHNEVELNLFSYIYKKKYYSKSFNPYIYKWGENDPDIKKQFGLWYRYIGIFIEKRKWRQIIRHPFLTIGMLFMRGFVGTVYLMRKK